MTATEKKRIQVQVDKELFDEAESIFNELGLNSTTAITVFYKRVVAQGGIPFSLELTKREKADLAVYNASKKAPVVNLDNSEKIEAWLMDEDE